MNLDIDTFFICPNCQTEQAPTTVCDNSCGTIECYSCQTEFYIEKEIGKKGHNPECGQDYFEMLEEEEFKNEFKNSVGEFNK